MNSTPLRYGCLKAVVWAVAILFAPSVPAQEAARPAATPPAPADTRSIEAQVNALESYLNNSPFTPPADAPNDAPAPKPVVIPHPAGAGVIMRSAVLSLLAVAGLGLFYGTTAGGANKRNVGAASLGGVALVVILWWAFGYSLAFGVNFQSPFLGGSEYFFARAGADSATSLGGTPNPNYTPFLSQNVFAICQAIYAVFCVALIVAALAQRVKWRTLLLFVAAWTLLVYCPIAHMAWGRNGLMNGLFNDNAKLPVLDFGGGLVVHVTAGWSVLVFALLLGLRPRWGRVRDQPQSIMRTIIGTALLWIGWLGFTLGSSTDVDGVAASVVTARTMAAGVGALVWVMLDVILRRPLPLRGFCLGLIAGLVAISPANGFVTNLGAAIIALCASAAAYVVANYLTTAPGFEIPRKVFAIHGAGGAVGVALTGLLADASVNSNLALIPNREEVMGVSTNAFDHPFFLPQLGALGVTLLVATVGTAAITLVLKAILKRQRTPESADAAASN